MRRALLLFFVISLFKNSPAIGDNGAERFAEANAKYASGDYEEAAKIYEGLLSSCIGCADEHANLGNTYFRLGKMGEARYQYESALQIAPRDPDIRWNLEVLKSVLPDKLDAPSGNLFKSAVRQAVGTFAENELALFLTLLLALGMFLALFSFLSPKFKRWAATLQGLVMAATLLSGVLFVIKWQDARLGRVVILDKEIAARYGPSNRETQAFTLHEGAVAKVLDKTNDWFYVTLEDQKSAWVPKKSCRQI